MVDQHYYEVIREFEEKKMSEFPAELKYASSHEWARLESDGSVVVGITDHAQAALTDSITATSDPASTLAPISGSSM